ncbi:hypothetical protein [Krasilnikoviella flava]|uniref:Uncharacterized protein n=1 Tax=Krasilnikoviella flava TaxID=526729 RepID=A0A1T5LJX6_9MICO|nr:hypothetical protein [Krasilnikoviella flava]SKC76297.1 hypothetical protein SAMN04324258_3571 [Krasilnikoviella flava]
MQARAVTVVALVTTALLAEPLAAVGAPALAAPATAATSAGVAAGPRDPVLDGRAVEDSAVDDVVRWQSAVPGPDLSRAGVRAQTDRSVHRVDVAVATPHWMSRTRAGQLVRDADVDALLAKVSAYWSSSRAAACGSCAARTSSASTRATGRARRRAASSRR